MHTNDNWHIRTIHISRGVCRRAWTTKVNDEPQHHTSHGLTITIETLRRTCCWTVLKLQTNITHILFCHTSKVKFGALYTHSSSLAFQLHIVEEESIIAESSRQLAFVVNALHVPSSSGYWTKINHWKTEYYFHIISIWERVLTSRLYVRDIMNTK
jgi:hypothetical protein